MGCDVEDILCQLETLRHLRGLKEQLGDKLVEQFPELDGLEPKLEEAITTRQATLETKMGECAQATEFIEDELTETEE